MIDDKHWNDCMSLDSYDRSVLKYALELYLGLDFTTARGPTSKQQSTARALMEQMDKWPHREKS